MTSQILSSELTSLIQESKRKLPELRNVSAFNYFIQLFGNLLGERDAT
jgi:hypothetical protein